MPILDMPQNMAATTPSGEQVPGKGRSNSIQDSSSHGATGLHFVVSNSVDKPNPELRKLIRRHVMMGKNRGKTYTRPSRKRKPQGVQDMSPSSFDASSRDLTGPPTSSSPSSTSASQSQSHSVLPATVPRKFGSDLSTIPFADAAEPATVEVVLQFSSIAKQVLYGPLHTCIFFERRAENWIAPLVIDPAYLHAMIFTSQYYFDAIAPRKFVVSQLILPHFWKTLKILRERFALDDDEAQISNTTAAAVLNLIGHAHMTGDSKSAKHHLEGLHKIVSLRGGVTTFKDNAKLLLEIFRYDSPLVMSFLRAREDPKCHRCDIAITLHSGSRPVFFDKRSSPEPFLPYPDLTPLLKLRKPNITASQVKYFDDIDDQLAQAWKIMSGFCSVINFAADSGQRITTETFLDTMASVMYRLLDMPFERGSINETIRLGLLVFSCGVFLQWKALGMSYPHLTSMFRLCIAGLTSSHISSQLQLWLLMVGAVSILDDTDDRWLKPLLSVNIALCQIDSWSRMQDLLRSFMWIGVIHDKPAKVVFDSTAAFLENPPLDL